MGYNATGLIALAASQNFLERLRTQLGYDGPTLLQREGRIVNTHATNPLYLFFTNSSQYPPGVPQVESVTVAGTITVAGNGVATVTGAGITTTAVNFPLTVGMSNAAKARSLIAALSANVYLNAGLNAGGLFDFSINNNVVSMSRRDPSGGNDGTLNLALADGTSTGLTAVVTSTHTTVGQSPAAVSTNGFKLLIAAPTDTYILPKGTDLSTIWTYTAGVNANVAIINN